MKNITQKTGFKPKPFILELFLKESQMREYYAAKREYLFRHGKILKGMAWRKKIHSVLLALLRLERVLFAKQQIFVIDDKTGSAEPASKKKNYFGALREPVIFAVTHIGMYDYPIISEALKVHQYPFAGDPESMYRSFDGLVFWLNGRVVCDTEIKSDRKVAKETAIEVLKSGMNLLIYPEGVWNITPNLPVLPLFSGVIDMHQSTGCPIVPVGIVQYGKKFVVKFGKPVEFSNVERKQAVEQLRDLMATLKWEIMESQGVTERSKIGDYETARRTYEKKRLNEWINPKTKKPWYTKQIVESRIKV